MIYLLVIGLNNIIVLKTQLSYYLVVELECEINPFRIGSNISLLMFVTL